MARIRSVHPGLFTDENYAVLSFPARELLKGLWIESDDNGIFEWKPLSIKMRVFPADAVEVPDLLEELTTNWIRPFEADGKRYGACKNFCKYQRPKKPKAVHPLPEEQKPYVMHGYKPRASEHDDDDAPPVPPKAEPVPHRFSTGTENAGQMEDGGDKGKRKKEECTAAIAAFETFWKACPKKEGRGDAEKAWAKAIKTVRPEILIAAMQRYAAKHASKVGAEREFIKHPGPWLNAKRWLDEGIAPAPPDPEVMDELGTAWNGEAARLVEAIGAEQFKHWFLEAKFEPGPPCQIVVLKQYQRDMIERKFASVLHKAYGHFEVRVAA